MDPVSIIFKVAQEIAKAAAAARRSRRRCAELAERALVVGGLVRDSKVAKDTETRTRVLDRLSKALGDALKLVESCRRAGVLSRLAAAGFGGHAGRFDDVERRINNCLMELGIANDVRREKQQQASNQFAGRGGDQSWHGKNAKSGSKKGTNNNEKKKNAAINGGGGTAAGGSGYKKRKNRRHAGGKGGKQTKQQKAAAGALPATRARAPTVHQHQPPRHQGSTGGDPSYPPPYVVYSIEDDPTSCSIM